MNSGAIEVRERPICNNETPRRCRKTAVASFDGWWVCQDHYEKVQRSLGRIAPRKIVWVR